MILMVRRTDKSERVWRSALPDITAAITTLRLLRSLNMVIFFMMVMMMVMVRTMTKETQLSPSNAQPKVAKPW